ncbi:unnamed protein product [Periconia digitata]|uniref:Uncharacterized protein n=1 Tax=Periconia digitata TaxID=1303443 RepID=A0A9W4XNM2_9PLEO|nr:unnamed protein product [Periconia digitata]
MGVKLALPPNIMRCTLPRYSRASEPFPLPIPPSVLSCRMNHLDHDRKHRTHSTRSSSHPQKYPSSKHAVSINLNAIFVQPSFSDCFAWLLPPIPHLHPYPFSHGRISVQSSSAQPARRSLMPLPCHTAHLCSSSLLSSNILVAFHIGSGPTHFSIIQASAGRLLWSATPIIHSLLVPFPHCLPSELNLSTPAAALPPSQWLSPRSH